MIYKTLLGLLYLIQIPYLLLLVVILIGCESSERGWTLFPAPAVVKDPRLDFAALVSPEHRDTNVQVFYATTRAPAPEEYPERYAEGSVANRIPQSTPQIAVVGKYDEPWRPVGVRYINAASDSGAPIKVIDALESGHFEMIDPDSSTWPLVLGAAHELLGIESS